MKNQSFYQVTDFTELNAIVGGSPHISRKDAKKLIKFLRDHLNPVGVQPLSNNDL